jgi:hypothetical protein
MWRIVGLDYDFPGQTVKEAKYYKTAARAGLPASIPDAEDEGDPGDSDDSHH